MIFLFFIFTLFIGSSAVMADKECSWQETLIKINQAHPKRVVDFSKAMGGGIDGHDKNRLFCIDSMTLRSNEKKSVVEKKPQNFVIHQMLKAGLQPLSYRLRTELGIESWHWNPSGQWSDAEHLQGYWTSSAQSTAPITQSCGYRLPRRGNTLDEANNDSYSRLDDGNLNTFWKSNPYLTSHYTGEPDSKHPQWVLIDFGKPVLVNAARLHWKNPFAKRYRIQYSCGGDLYFGHNRHWHDFPNGKFIKVSGGSPMLHLGTPHNFFGTPIPIQYLRILMTESSGTASPGSKDPRDFMGYALGEIECGFLESTKFSDRIIHRPDQKQTIIYASSTDPWHRACDRDERTQQPGLDLIAESGLGNTQPILWSVPFFYDTPENAATEVDFLKKRGYLFASQSIELGEESDGQRVDPKDVGELYAQTSKKIHSSHSDLSLGGLSFVTIDVNPGDLIYRVDKRPWLHRFLKQLEKKREGKNFQFLTFEWYPFDDLLLPPAPLLINQPRRLKESMERIRHGGIPKKMPLMISEYGYSVFSGEPEVTLAAALLQADIAATFLLLGGTTSYLYGYEPNHLECNYGNSWGNLMMFLQSKENPEHLQPLPTFYSSRLLTHQWAPPSGGPCDIYSTTIKSGKKSATPDLSAYFLSAKDHGSRWNALLLVNKNPKMATRFKCVWERAFETRWLARIFHTDRDEKVAKADGARRAMKSDDGCVCTHCLRRTSSSTQHPAGFPAFGVDWHGIFGLPRIFHTDRDEEVAKADGARHAMKSDDICACTHCLRRTSSSTQHPAGFPAFGGNDYETSGLDNITGAWDCYSYSADQYQWHAAGAQGCPKRNQPPSKSSYQAEITKGFLTTSLEFKKNGVPITLPPWSITVLQHKNLPPRNHHHLFSP
jgi:hypothetical protein